MNSIGTIHSSRPTNGSLDHASGRIRVYSVLGYIFDIRIKHPKVSIGRFVNRDAVIGDLADPAMIHRQALSRRKVNSVNAGSRAVDRNIAKDDNDGIRSAGGAVVDINTVGS